MAVFSAGFIGRLSVILMLAFQSPFMVSKTGSGMSPIAVATKFLVENAKKEGHELNDQAHMVLRVLNWPAHMLEQCALLGSEGNCDPIFVWENAIPHAVKSTGFWQGLADQHKQVLFGGATTTIFGAIISFVTGRTHLLAVLGGGLTGYGIHLNGLMPTFQFIIVLLISLTGIRARGARDLPGPPPTATPARSDIPAQAAQAANKAKSKKSGKAE